MKNIYIIVYFVHWTWTLYISGVQSSSGKRRGGCRISVEPSRCHVSLLKAKITWLNRSNQTLLDWNEYLHPHRPFANKFRHLWQSSLASHEKRYDFYYLKKLNFEVKSSLVNLTVIVNSEYEIKYVKAKEITNGKLFFEFRCKKNGSYLLYGNSILQNTSV